MGPLHDNIFSFTDRQSAANSIASLFVETNNRPDIAVFHDLEKVFELASPTTRADILSTNGVSGLLLRWTHDYLSTDQVPRAHIVTQNPREQIISRSPQFHVI